ncbi:hypothetical protein PSEUBRA_001157 [Kalmanozyma brasiliensis GHG001]|uniref:uncharacterized protein n=1 Tax=Kalmanozyma brasiliensis (strain GHG001) TaxID=1365824 RepID=UPI002867E5B2|nr:uncharacterized protein PSEUBRA_001157 [Kalmanozyma brasiliensis GHG001]EST09205.2 hypothetical protein PSEUBRA_001157 [Kalmanozyma brasiliensis GHG001]
MVTSRSGAVTTIVLRQGDIKWLPKLDLLVASIFTDQDSFDSLQAACAAKMLVKVYRVFDDEGKECRVLDESMALSKVTFLRTCCIHSVEREDTLQARVTLGSGISMDAVGGSNLMKITRFLHDSLVSLDEAEQTFLGFRCSVCGKANRRGSLIIASCTHCNTTFAITASCSSKSLSRKRAGNLQFTGPRSSLGQVNMVLSKDDVAQRFVSTFSDGTRLCTYHIVRSSSHNDSSSQARILSSSHTLHHILGPGQGDELSSESFALPSTPFIRLTSETEAKLRIQGYALSFGVQNQTWDQIYPRHRDFESASQGVLEQIAHLRRSLLLSDVPQGQSSKYHKPSGILLLLLQNSTLKIDSSMFPGPSSHFGIVSLSGSICVSIRRDKQAPNHSPARERQPKGVSVGSFVLQPQDTCVGRTDALQAIELELSSKGVTLWALAHFAQSTPTRSQ